MKKALFVLIATYFLAEWSGAYASPLKSVVLKIYADQGWQDSGISFRAGQHYSISAWGTWASGVTRAVGPEGLGLGTLTEDALLGMVSVSPPKQLNYDSFTRKIVTEIIRIGRGGEFNAPGAGKLWLCMGDWSGCKECSGYVEVLIIVYE